MKNNFIDSFKLLDEKEAYDVVLYNIDKGATFRGTNLWILIFAIFIASLGLNVNSPSVIIGAMLVSPLMGPIMGMGLGMGINDLSLLRKAFMNYLFSLGVGLTTSTIYFLLSPINEAHSELLSRVSPNIYDVLIALFGGLAGILAISSKQKGNVIPGVAIATALMPPLCTAGYGLATLNWFFFLGALYLFIINTVFIGFATLITVRLLHFPYKTLLDKTAEIKSERMVTLLLIATLIPSIYFGYDIVQQERFTENASKFIKIECVLPNDYLLNKKIDPKKKTIELTYGGKEISKEEIGTLKSKLKNYNLTDVTLEIRQGFAYLKNENKNENSQINQLTTALAVKEKEVQGLKDELDSINNQNKISKQIFAELKINYPDLKNAVIDSTAIIRSKSVKDIDVLLVFLEFPGPVAAKEKLKIENWLKVRTERKNIKIIFDSAKAKVKKIK